MARPESASRDWMLSILVPTIELRDALITDVVRTIRGVSERPTVAVRLIAVVDDAEKPTLTLHIRSRTAISGEQAEVTFTPDKSSRDEPSMR